MYKAIHQAQSLINENKLTEALTLYTSIDMLNLNPEEQYTVSADIGFILYELGKIEESIHYLLEALTIEHPDNGSVNKMLGFAYIEQKNYELAVEYMEEASTLIENEKEKAICEFELARNLMILEDFTLSERYFTKSLPYFKTTKSDYYGSSLYYIGQIQFMNQAIDIAEEYFNELIALKSQHHQAHGYFGKLFIANSQQNAERMQDYASKVLELESDFYDIETITFFTVKSYQYLNDKIRYDEALKQFINRYPDGKYQLQYEQLKNHVFKLTEI